MSTYYYICPYCGAFLDPGERCDCEKQRPAARHDRDVREQDPKEKRSGDNGERAQLSVNQ